GNGTGHLEAGKGGEPGEEGGDVALPLLTVGVEPGELGEGERGLYGVEFGVAAPDVGAVGPGGAEDQLLAELAGHADVPGQIGVVRGDEPSLPARGKVLGVLEAEGGGVAQRSRASVADRRAVGL